MPHQAPTNKQKHDLISKLTKQYCNNSELAAELITECFDPETFYHDYHITVIRRLVQRFAKSPAATNEIMDVVRKMELSGFQSIAPEKPVAIVSSE